MIDSECSLLNILFIDIVEVKDRLSLWKRALFCVCGLSADIREEQKTAEQHQAHLKDVISLKQDPRAKKVLWVNSIILITVSIFLLIYYTVPDGGPTAPTIDIPYLPFINNGTRP